MAKLEALQMEVASAMIDGLDEQLKQDLSQGIVPPLQRGDWDEGHQLIVVQTNVKGVKPTLYQVVTDSELKDITKAHTF